MFVKSLLKSFKIFFSMSFKTKILLVGEEGADPSTPLGNKFTVCRVCRFTTHPFNYFFFLERG